jgi:hypothetical protein
MNDISAQVTVTLNFNAVTAEILMGAVRGQNMVGERGLALSSQQVPFDNGDLSESGQVVNAEQIGDTTQIVYDRPQAARLHEHPEYNFSTDSNPGAKGKYLEDPMMQNLPELRAIIAKGAGGA